MRAFSKVIISYYYHTNVEFFLICVCFFIWNLSIILSRDSKTIQGLRSFSDTLPKNIKKIIKKKGHIYSETLNNWKYIAGR